MNSTQVQRRVQRVRHELRARPVQVSRIEPLGECFLGVTFAGEALADFHSAAFDDHVKFIFDSPAGEQVRRDYTPRRFDAHKRELTIEFALHGEGQACDWARRAAVGQPVVIAGPRGSLIVPLDCDWHLLIGDASKARARLGWAPRVTFAELVTEMIREDLKAAERDHLVRTHGYPAPAARATSAGPDSHTSAQILTPKRTPPNSNTQGATPASK